ncbi:MAG: hypothetical protein E7186_04845 [Erysipelotrichaceae bacterium]|nr:hypothetical protein [Erysipelotrichaceae bacterium]
MMNIISNRFPDPEEQLKDRLKDYYGTAAVNGFPMAVIELNEIDDLDEEELEELADQLGIR